MKRILLKETAPEIMPKNNIVVIQCLFRNMLTNRQLDVSTQIVSPRLRRGLDFELYYQLDGEVVKRLLDTTLLVTNCRNWKGITDQEQIVDILAPYEPIACFLTDSFGDQITGDEMSPESQKILRQRNAQGQNFSVFRFSFFYAGYSAVWKQLMAWKDTGEIIPDGYSILVSRSGKPAGVRKLDGSGEQYRMDQVQTLSPFLASGYWTGFAWDANRNAFVKNSDIAGPFIPSLVNGKWRMRETSMFKSVVKCASDIDWSGLTGLLEKAVSKAMTSGRDLRTKAAESVYIDYIAHMLDESTYE